MKSFITNLSLSGKPSENAINTGLRANSFNKNWGGLCILEPSLITLLGNEIISPNPAIQRSLDAV
jgi:hypothetical protein